MPLLTLIKVTTFGFVKGKSDGVEKVTGVIYPIIAIKLQYFNAPLRWSLNGLQIQIVLFTKQLIQKAFKFYNK
jgi:hypothetical protein